MDDLFLNDLTEFVKEDEFFEEDILESDFFRDVKDATACISPIKKRYRTPKKKIYKTNILSPISPLKMNFRTPKKESFETLPIWPSPMKFRDNDVEMKDDSEEAIFNQCSPIKLRLKRKKTPIYIHSVTPKKMTPKISPPQRRTKTQKEKKKVYQTHQFNISNFTPGKTGIPNSPSLTPLDYPPPPPPFSFRPLISSFSVTSPPTPHITFGRGYQFPQRIEMFHSSTSTYPPQLPMNNMFSKTTTPLEPSQFPHVSRGMVNARRLSHERLVMTDLEQNLAKRKSIPRDEDVMSDGDRDVEVMSDYVPNNSSLNNSFCSDRMFDNPNILRIQQQNQTVFRRRNSLPCFSPTKIIKNRKKRSAKRDNRREGPKGILKKSYSLKRFPRRKSLIVAEKLQLDPEELRERLKETKSYKGNLPLNAVEILKEWFLAHMNSPYPTPDEKKQLCLQTNLSKTQISNWFTNKRKRVWKTYLKELMKENEMTDV